MQILSGTPPPEFTNGSKDEVYVNNELVKVSSIEAYKEKNSVKYVKINGMWVELKVEEKPKKYDTSVCYEAGKMDIISGRDEFKQQLICFLTLKDFQKIFWTCP